MPLSGESAAARALDFVQQLNARTTQDQVIDLVAAGLAEFGFEHFVMTGLPAPYERFEQVVLMRHWPAGWFEHYASERFVEVDPVIRRCRETVNPFEWSEAAYDVEREPRAHQLMTRAVDFGLRRGFSLPIHGLGTDGCFSMSGANPDLTEETKPIFHLMATYAYERARHLGGGARPHSENPLTPREREILCWAFAGKTGKETSDILGISPHTVQSHVTSVMNKLGAATRVQAVGRAMQLNYITV